MERVVTSKEMRACDSAATRELGLTADLLMERAGLGVVSEILSQYGPLSGRGVAVLCGKGHNGGDGLVIARLLASAGAHVTAILLAPEQELAPATRLQARRYERLLRCPPHDSTCRLLRAANGRAFSRLRPDGIIVDALFGTGFSGRPKGVSARAIAWANSQNCPVVSVDMPSGLDSDGGVPGGPVVRASLTVTFQARKVGQLSEHGRSSCAQIRVVDIGIADAIMDRHAQSYRVIDPAGVATMLPVRLRTAHKNSVGKVLIVAGSVGYAGAAIMSAQAAMRAGAGAVILCAPQSLYGVLSRRLTEVMVMPVAEGPRGTFCAESFPEIAPHCDWADVLVAGPGMGHGSGPESLLAALLRRWNGRLLLDADALTIAAKNLRLLRRHPSETVLTPHVGEFSRLSSLDARSVERTRLTAPKEFARRHRVTLALKGAPTVVAGPDGPTFINATGNPGMATAGSGDVLTGTLAALWAQGMGALEATCAAVHVHGAAGDLARERFGERGLLATDILEAIPQAMCALETAGGA